MSVRFKLQGTPQETKSGFEAYDGPIPVRPGAYRAKIRQLKLKRFRSGSVGFFIVTDFEASAGDPKKHAQFDGYTMFIQNIIVQTADGSPLKEASQRNVDNFLYALGVKGSDPDILHEKGDLDDGVNITKIGGVNPIGKYVSIDARVEEYGGEPRLSSNGIFRDNSDRVAPKQVEESADEDEGYDDDEPEEQWADEEETGETREDELASMTLPALKKLAKELGVTASNKQGYIEAILEAEAEEGDEDTDEEESEDEEEETEEETEEEDETEEEEDDEAAALREELTGLARPKLVARLKSHGGRALKSDSDDDLIEKIVQIEVETPF